MSTQKASAVKPTPFLWIPDRHPSVSTGNQGKAMYLLPALIFVPVLFFMLVWAVVTMGRILFPERPLPFDRTFSLRGWTMRPRHRAPVHVTAPRATTMPHVAQADYHFEEGHSDGFPGIWLDDLWLRRN